MWNDVTIAEIGNCRSPIAMLAGSSSKTFLQLICKLGLIGAAVILSAVANLSYRHIVPHAYTDLPVQAPSFL
jgi:hypothetical protein